MTDADHQWGLSNPGPDTLYLWLEPWADEIEAPVRSTITFDPSGGPEDCPLGQVEWTTDHLLVWATAQRVAVFVDGELQHTGSAVIAVPDGLTKGMLGIVFADQPAARLGGAPSDPIGSTERLQLGAMKRRTLLSIFVALLVGISAGWAARDFVAQDRCLDQGGAWSGDLSVCKLPLQNVR